MGWSYRDGPHGEFLGVPLASFTMRHTYFVTGLQSQRDIRQAEAADLRLDTASLDLRGKLRVVRPQTEDKPWLSLIEGRE